MSSKLFKAVIAGGATVGALLLPVSAAQAAPKHLPCDDPGFGHGAFFGHGFGFRHAGFRHAGFGFHDAGFGFQDDDFGFPDGDFGFDEPRPQVNDTTIIIVTDQHKKKKHHKPAATGNGNSAGAGYQKPADTSAGSNGYRKSVKDS